MRVNRQICKVKFDGSRVEIRYTVARGGGDPDEYELKCRDLPRKEFEQALKDLRPHAAKILELDEDYLEKATVRGVTFSFTNDVMGAVMTIIRPLETANAPLILNTPHLPSESYNEDSKGGNDLLLSPECVDALKALESEANAYIDGQRAQGMLNFGDGVDTVTLTCGDKTVVMGKEGKAA